MIKRLMFLSVALSFSFVAAADKVEPFLITPSDIKYVYDGDTFFIECRHGIMCNNGKLGIRPPNLDTPEIKGKCEHEITLARKAKQFTVEVLRSAVRIDLKPLPNRPYDRYGRLLAYTVIDGNDLADLLITAGLGRPYGKGRRSWCD